MESEQPTENPYHTSPTIADSSDSWEVRDGLLYCTRVVTLPKVCYATQATDGLISRDIRVRYYSGLSLSLSIATWLLFAGGMLAVSRWFIASVTWQGILLATVAVFALDTVLGRFTQTKIRIRLYESNETRQQRRKLFRTKWFLRGLMFLFFAASIWWMLEFGSSPLVFASVVLAGAGMALPDLIGLKKSLMLSGTKDGNFFCIAGFSLPYIEALRAKQTDTANFLGCTNS